MKILFFWKKFFFQKIRKISKIFQIFSFFTFFLVFKKNLFAAVFISFNKLLKVEKLSLKQSVDFIQKSKELKHYSFLPFRKDKQRKRKNCLYRNFHLSKESEFFIKNFFFPQNFSFFNEKKINIFLLSANRSAPRCGSPNFASAALRQSHPPGQSPSRWLCLDKAVQSAKKIFIY